MEDSKEKDYSFLGNDTFLNLYDALVTERKFKSEYLERQIYERLLKSEPSIVKLSESNAGISGHPGGVDPRDTQGHGGGFVEKPCSRAWGICISGQTPPGSYPRDLQMV